MCKRRQRKKINLFIRDVLRKICKTFSVYQLLKNTKPMSAAGLCVQDSRYGTDAVTQACYGEATEVLLHTECVCESYCHLLQDIKNGRHDSVCNLFAL